MSTTINTGWLKDNNGEKFAPKTLVSQVITSDGKLFEDEIKSQLDNIDVGIEITKAEYDALGDAVLTDGKTYFITDAGNEGGSAKDVVFDNKASGLGAVNVQDAIDELKINGSGSGSIDLTEAEYKELETSGEVDSDITYYITDGVIEEEEVNDASSVMYDDTNTQLGVNNVQSAIEKLASNSGSDVPIFIQVNVIANESLIGQTITITNGEETFSEVVPDDMKVSFQLPSVGTWVITDPISGMNTEVKTNFYGVYEVELKSYKKFTVIIDLKNPDPLACCTYADDAVGMTKGGDAWWDQVIFKDLRNCLLVEGVVTGYLNKNNLTLYEDGTTASLTTTGSDVMLEIPYRVGYRIEWRNTGKTKLEVSITDHPNHPDYKYDAFSLDSYNDCDRIYIGTYEAYITSNKAYSLSGKTVTEKTIDEWRNACRARGTGYQMRTYGSHKLIQCLYTIFYGNLDSQIAVGYGVSNSSPTFLSTGKANSYGFMSEIIKNSNPTYMTDGTHAVKVFGLENLWGNKFEFVDGAVTDEKYNVLTCDCAVNFNSAGDGYVNSGKVGVTSDIEGEYMSSCIGNSNAGFVATKTEGEDGTYFSDISFIRTERVCAVAGSDPGTGIFYTEFDTNTEQTIACRLMYMHKEETV